MEATSASYKKVPVWAYRNTGTGATVYSVIQAQLPEEWQLDNWVKVRTSNFIILSWLYSLFVVKGSLRCPSRGEEDDARHSPVSAQ